MVGGDVVKPCRKGGITPELAQGPVSLDEDFLGRLFRFGFPAQKGITMAAHLLLVFEDQRGKGLGMAG